jgi:acyl transferase domain-containing protein
MTPSISSDSLEEVVIVGQALRLPGDINNADEFWAALTQKREDIIGPIPEDRWDHASFYKGPDSELEERPCDITLDKAGFINITDFDHTFFGISSIEAYHVAPNIRLTLEIAFEALENANIPVSRVKGSDMGVFVAANMDEGHIKLLYSEKGWGGMMQYFSPVCR